MPPKKGSAKAETTPKVGRGGRQKVPAKGKKGEGDTSDDEHVDEQEFLKVANKKKGVAKKPASEDEDELDDEEFDDEEFDEDDEEVDDDGDEDFEVGQQTLFMKNLPSETTPEQVKALSADIQDVRMDVSQNKNEKNPKYAILEFKDRETAERNLQLLKGQLVNGVVAYVDFVAGHTETQLVKPQLTPSSDPLKLYVTGFGRDIVIDQLKEMFPTSSDITLPLNPKDNNRPVGYAFIHYSDEAVAKEAHDSMQDYVYQGRTLVVMYGKKSRGELDNAFPQEKRKASGEKGSSAKRAKKNSADDEEDDVEEDEEEGEDEEEDLDDEEEEDEEEDDEENE